MLLVIIEAHYDSRLVGKAAVALWRRGRPPEPSLPQAPGSTANLKAKWALRVQIPKYAAYDNYPSKSMRSRCHSCTRRPRVDMFGLPGLSCLDRDPGDGKL